MDIKFLLFEESCSSGRLMDLYMFYDPVAHPFHCLCHHVDCISILELLKFSKID